MKAATVTIRLDEELDKLLTEASQQSGKSRSEIAREALRRQLHMGEREILGQTTKSSGDTRGYLTDEDVSDEVS